MCIRDSTHGDQLEYLRRVTNTTYDYAKVINEAFKNSSDFDAYDNEIGLEKQLRLVARLIKGGLGSKIYMVSIGGFDTHGNQSLTHEVLLTYVADAIKKFYDDLNYEGLDSKVLSMTFSELYSKSNIRMKRSFLNYLDLCINYDFITKKPMGQNVIYSITEKGTTMLNLFTRTEKN